MTQNTSTADQGKEVPTVSILPVGNPVPLPSTEALAGESLQDATTEGRKAPSTPDSTAGEKK